jgi:hypothetical protein
MIVKKPVSGREVTRRLCYFDEVGVGQRVGFTAERDSGDHEGVRWHVSPGKTCWSTWVREGGKDRWCFLPRFPLFPAPSHPTWTPPSLVSSFLSLSFPLSSEKQNLQSFASTLGLYLLGSTWPISCEPSFLLSFYFL